MKNLATLALGLSLAAFLVPALPACHHGYVQVGVSPDGYYDYDYYPDSEVYFYPSGGTYYWRDHDAWHHGRDLPNNFHLEHESHVPLHLHTANPYEQHAQTHTQYPGGHHEEEHH